MNVPPGKINKHKSCIRGNNSNRINNRFHTKLKKQINFWPYANSRIKTLRSAEILERVNPTLNTATLATYFSMPHISPPEISTNN
jgi:hypothetical protein